MGDESIRILGSAPLYCARCDEVTECLAIPPELLSHPTTRQRQHRDCPSIRWYRRIRLYLKCKHKSMTAEIDEEQLVNWDWSKMPSSSLHFGMHHMAREALFT
jgi:hypothetical protein